MKTHHHHPTKLKSTPRPLFSCLSSATALKLYSVPPTLSLQPYHHHHRPLHGPSLQPHRRRRHRLNQTPSHLLPQALPRVSPNGNSHSHLPPHDSHPRPDPSTQKPESPPPLPPPMSTTDLQELFHVVELQLSTGSDSEWVRALHMLERSLVPNPHSVGDEALCPAAVMGALVGNLKEKAGAKPATKVLLALCLAEGNRHVAVEAGAVGRVVKALADLEGLAAERALAALELLCTVAEGAAEVRCHALAVPMLVEVMGKMAGRGREYAIGVLAVIYSGDSEDAVPVAPPEELARAVVLALRGDCTTRGKKKGPSY